MNQDPKELIREVYEKIRSISPDFIQRITKNSSKPETMEKLASDDFELLLIRSLSQGIKLYGNDIFSNDALSSLPGMKPLHAHEKSPYNDEDDYWLIETRRYIYEGFKKLQKDRLLPVLNYDIMENLGLLSKIEIDDMITLYEKDLRDLFIDNERRQSELERNAYEELKTEETVMNLDFDPNDVMSDIKLTFAEDEKFIALMERRQNDPKPVSIDGKAFNGQEGTKTVQKSRKTILEDMVCQVCNDGDYTEDDLIVFCSVRVYMST